MGSSRLHRALSPVIRAGRRAAERWDILRFRARAREITGDPTLDIRSVRRTRAGMHIMRVSGMRTGPAILKVSGSPTASATLARERLSLEAIHRERTADDLASLLPRVIQVGSFDGRSFILEEELPGEPASTLFADELRRDQALQNAASTALRVHRLGIQRRSVGHGGRAAWVHRPVQTIAWLVGPDERQTLRTMTDELLAILPSTVTTGWIHGDFWGENILVEPSTGQVTGIVDWDSAAPAEPALHDLLHLVLYTRKKRRRTEIGEEIVRALGPKPEWRASESTIVEQAVASIEAEGVTNGHRAALVLYWLRLVSVNLERQSGLVRRRRWVDDNVRQVIACL